MIRRAEWYLALAAAVLGVPTLAAVVWPTVGPGMSALFALFVLVVALLLAAGAWGAHLHARLDRPIGLALLWASPVLLVGWLVFTGSPIGGLAALPLALAFLAALCGTVTLVARAN